MDTGALAEAIRTRHVVELLYSGGSSAAGRVVHPHALYRTASGGTCLDALQVAGSTSSGRLPAWRQFSLMKVVDVRVLETRFDVSADFDPASDKYRLGLIAAVRS